MPLALRDIAVLLPSGATCVTDNVATGHCYLDLGTDTPAELRAGTELVPRPPVVAPVLTAGATDPAAAPG